MTHQHLVLVLTYIVSLVYTTTDTKYRLNTSIIPSEYHLLITPYFDTNDEKAFTFNGEVTIRFTTTASTNQIKLHSVDLNYTATNISVSNLNTSATIDLNDTNPLEFNTNYSFAYINLQNELVPNFRYAVKILYVAPLKEDLAGFYRGYYLEQGEKKWMAATHMEPTHARTVFPCFDEPKLKARFTIQIDRPSNYKNSLSNTKIRTSEDLGNGYNRETFYPTPLMSTYLVAFVVSEMEPGEYRHGSREFGIYARPTVKNQTSYAFDFGLKVVDELGAYFGIDYYSMNTNFKLDLVAMPNFHSGAMENWGLIMYREPLLLYDPTISGPDSRLKVAQLVAHEISHMWFGNLVTCHWWSDTWLQEGFADYFQNYIPAVIQPELGSANLLVLDSVYTAYDADDSNFSVPITNNVNSPPEISGQFGSITYKKAGSVIRMIHRLIEDDAFKLGLHTYLMNNSFGSGNPDLLYTALDYGVSTFNSLNTYPNISVADVMDSWVTQPGYPILHVNVNFNNDTVTLTQERFYSDPSTSSSEIYKIPITYATRMSPNFYNTKPAFIMDTRTSKFTIANISKSQAWVIFNIQETGLYRVNYDNNSWHMITLALKGSDFNTIHHLNRAKIVNDLFDLFFAYKVQFSTLHQVLEFLLNENDYSVWFAALKGFKRLRRIFVGNTDAKPIIEAYMLRFLSLVINRIGYEERVAIDAFEDLRNRQQILEFACTLDHIGCINHTLALFKELKENGIEVPASLRSVVYSTGLRYGNADDYDFLWDRMINTDVASEVTIIIKALSYTSHKEKLKSYLFSTTVGNSPIKTQDPSTLLHNVLSNYSNWHTVIDLIKSDYSLVSTIYERTTVAWIIYLVAFTLKTDRDFNEFEAFLEECAQCTEHDKSVGRDSLKDAWKLKIRSDLRKEDILSILRNFN